MPFYFTFIFTFIVVPFTFAVIIAEPFFFAVTLPEELTVATDFFEVDHVAPEIVVPS